MEQEAKNQMSVEGKEGREKKQEVDRDQNQGKDRLLMMEEPCLFCLCCIFVAPLLLLLLTLDASRKKRQR